MWAIRAKCTTRATWAIRAILVKWTLLAILATWAILAIWAIRAIRAIRVKWTLLAIRAIQAIRVKWALLATRGLSVDLGLAIAFVFAGSFARRLFFGLCWRWLRSRHNG